MDKAIEYLREKGLAASAKKAGRIAAEGMAYAAVIDGVGVVVEVNAETDFVGKNEKFVDFVKGVAAVVAKENPADLEALMAARTTAMAVPLSRSSRRWSWSSARTSRSAALPASRPTPPSPYIHAGGKIGVLVNFKVDGGIDATEIAQGRCHADRGAQSPLLG